MSPLFNLTSKEAMPPFRIPANTDNKGVETYLSKTQQEAPKPEGDSVKITPTSFLYDGTFFDELMYKAVNTIEMVKNNKGEYEDAIKAKARHEDPKVLESLEET